MKTGIKLISDERKEQLEKHNRSLQEDYECNDRNQLAVAATWLIEGGIDMQQRTPSEWDEDIWLKMVRKSYKERLIIAGALIAAEIDRLQYGGSEV
jgi:hypothetical protein